MKNKEKMIKKQREREKKFHLEFVLLSSRAINTIMYHEILDCYLCHKYTNSRDM
jgi:nitrate/TMAO reductase-like tetraheme cytochrome c subunit